MPPPKDPKNKDPKNKPDPNEPPLPVEPIIDAKTLQQVTQQLAEAKGTRNYFQLERDKINKFWEISKKELENAKYELCNADHELEEMERTHQVEMKVYKQKVRHLLYEHKMQVQDIRGQSDKDITQATQEHQERMAQLREEKRKLHQFINSDMKAHEEEMGVHRFGHHEMVSRTKPNTYETLMREAQKKYELKLGTLRDELELRRRAEIHEIEERKNEHINELVKKHEEAFHEMKTYYNQITTNNLELIKSLKEEIANMSRNEKHNENLMHEIDKENKEMDKPLEEVRADVAKLQQDLHNYEKNKLSLRNTRKRLRALDIEYKELQESHSKLQNKYKDVHTDKDSLVAKFEAALRDAQDVVQEKNLSLQQRLQQVQQSVESRDAQLASVLAAVNLEPATLELVTRKLEDVLETKNRAIKDLHFELKKIEKRHMDVVSEYERRCIKAKIPPLDPINL